MPLAYDATGLREAGYSQFPAHSGLTLMWAHSSKTGPVHEVRFVHTVHEHFSRTRTRRKDEEEPPLEPPPKNGNPRVAPGEATLESCVGRKRTFFGEFVAAR